MQEIENYLIENNAGQAMAEAKSAKGLTDKTRRSLINQLAGQYAAFRFGDCIHSQYLQELLYRSGGGGWLYDKIKYLRRQSNLSKASVETDESEPDNEIQENYEKNCQENLDILKTTIVNDSNMALIKSKLEATSQYRLKLLQDKSIDLLETFPYFFVDPKLVSENKASILKPFLWVYEFSILVITNCKNIFIRLSYQVLFDFELMYKNSNPQSFLETWLALSVRLRNVLETQYSEHLFATMWSADFENLLILLKLLPFKSTGRNNVAPAKTFLKSTEKFIVFSKVNQLCHS